MGATSSRAVIDELGPQCVAITGGSSGIGAALAVEFAGPGVCIAITGRDHDRLQSVSIKCAAKGARVIARTVGVTDRDGMQKFLAEVDAQHPLDLVIANAGVMGLDAPLCESLHTCMETNVMGVLNTVIPAIRLMKPRGAGHIAIMSSLSALPTNPVKFAGKLGLGFMPYTLSKKTLMLLGDGLREELRDSGIQVTTLCPSVVESGMSDSAKSKGMKNVIPAQEAAKIIKEGLCVYKEVVAFPQSAVRKMKLAEWLSESVVIRAIAKDKRLEQRRAQHAELNKVQLQQKVPV